MPTALVTGAPDRVTDVAIALKSQGYEILSAGHEVPTAPGGLAPGSVDCYVQLPGGAVLPESGALSRTRSLVADELLARFDTTAEVAPLLAPGAIVVLVADRGGDPTRPGGSHRPPGLNPLRPLVALLAEAILADHGREGVRARLVDGDRSAAEIAAAAAPPVHRPPEATELSSIEPDLSFSDWRDEVFCRLSSA